MLKRKVKVIWLILVLTITSLAITSGFFYYNWQLQRKLEVLNVPVRSTLNQPPDFLSNIEGEKKEEYMISPLAVTVYKDNVYVTDSKNNRINVYNKKGKFLFSFGKKGLGDGEFLYPSSLTVDKKGNIYVGEFQNARVQVFNGKGKHLKTFVGAKDNLIIPLSLTIHDDNLYIANRTGEIVVLDLEGKVLERFGKNGNSPGALSFPNGVAVHKDGRVFVSDSGNSRVQVFSPEGEFLEILVSEAVRINLPRGLAFDDFNRLYVVDTFNHTILVFDEELNFLYTFGDRGLGEGQLNFPNSIFVDSEFKIFVADRENKRIAIFNYQ